MHFIHYTMCFKEFLHFNALFFKKLIFFFRFSIDRTCCSIDQNCNKNFGFDSALLDWYSIDARPIKTEKFSVFKYLTNLFFFMHHLCLGFTCISLFLYLSCSFAVISHIVFTHNMHTLY